MTVGAVNQVALARIIAVCERSDLDADIVGYGVISFTLNIKDGTSVINSNTFRYTRRYRAEKAARKTVHIAHSFWLTGMGLFFGRWA